MIGAACSGVTNRGVPSTKMKPRASAPASTATLASSRFVIPQTLTLTIERALAELRAGAGRARLPELVLVEGEVLAEEGQRHGRADRREEVEAPLEVLLVGEDRDRVGARRGVAPREGERVEVAREDAAGG